MISYNFCLLIKPVLDLYKQKNYLKLSQNELLIFNQPLNLVYSGSQIDSITKVINYSNLNKKKS